MIFALEVGIFHETTRNTKEKEKEIEEFALILTKEDRKKYVERLSEAVISHMEWLASGGNEIAHYGCNVVSWRISVSSIRQLVERIICLVLELAHNFSKISVRRQKWRSLRGQWQMDLLTTDAGENYCAVFESGGEVSEALPDDLAEADYDSDSATIGGFEAMSAIGNALHFGKKFPTASNPLAASGNRLTKETFAGTAR
ncbi:MAG: hypothetical protein LBI61_00845 [Puniceicoccales bacterium]|jgi:hypothetical protein|nr:hypothetical protein [Puniceicoccales bacterium]